MISVLPLQAESVKSEKPERFDRNPANPFIM
jgi:hypothetical protein